MDEQRFQTLEVPNHEGEDQATTTRSELNTFDPKTLLLKYIEARNEERRAKAIKDDITQQLLDHYDETGELVSDGFFTMVPRERVTVTVDADALKASDPKLYAKCLGFDKKIADALVKAKLIKQEVLDQFSTRKVSRYIDVKGEKE